MGCLQSLEQSRYAAVFTVVATGAFTSSSQGEPNQPMHFLRLSFYFIIIHFGIETGAVRHATHEMKAQKTPKQVFKF